MTQSSDGPHAAFIESGCSLLGIPLDPAWQEAVAFNLRTILGQAATLLAEPIPDETDPAPEFHP